MLDLDFSKYFSWAQKLKTASVDIKNPIHLSNDSRMLCKGSVNYKIENEGTVTVKNLI